MSRIKLRSGMKVRVIAVPPNEPEYPESLIGAIGTCGDESADGWIYVNIDGEDYEFKTDELECVNVKVIEGVSFRDNYGHVMFNEDWLSNNFDSGKRYRVTIEELPTK